MKFNWKINSLEVLPDDLLGSVVTRIFVVCQAVDGPTVIGSQPATIELGSADPTNFVPTDKLSAELLISWIDEVKPAGWRQQVEDELEQALSEPQPTIIPFSN